MPGNNSSGEKTEQPTPRRLEKAREEGQVAKSQELNLSFTLLGSFMVLYLLFNNILQSLSGKMARFLSLKALPELTKANSLNIIVTNFLFMARLVGPLLLGTAIVGVIISFIQVGPMFTSSAIQPKFSKINPLEGAKRLLSLKSLIELAKSLAKAAVFISLTYLQLKGAWPQLISLGEQGVQPALLFVGQLIFKIALNLIIFLILLGVADYIYQRWEFMKSMRMTKQEVKEEFKESEGDPQIKSRRRQLQRQMSMNRMINAMDEADVVITNPTHIAVALKFKIDTMDVPVVVAKGEGYLAQKIKEKARELEIEIVENKPLARSLNETTEIGDEIPPDLYQAVAEVLAFVFKNSQGYN